MADSLDGVISISDIVAVAKIARFTEDPGASEELRKTGNFMGGTNPFPNQPRGMFSFTILARLKGNSPDNLDFHSPPIDGASHYGDPDLKIDVGSLCLLYLEHKSDGSWVPSDMSRPIVPLGSGIDLSGIRQTSEADVAGIIAKLLVDSLSDPRVRRSAAFGLQQVRSPAVVAAVRPLLDDPDIQLQQNAQCCLAANQDVEAIPRIAELERKERQIRGGNRAVVQLRNYDDPKAVPYLNVLLLDGGSQYTRINAMAALRNLADKSSIPYLMISLKDPEPQGEVAFGAHLILHKLIPELGPTTDRATFMRDVQVRDAEVKRVESWCVDELAGKHGSGPQLVRPGSMTPPIPPAQPNPRGARGPAD